MTKAGGEELAAATEKKEATREGIDRKALWKAAATGGNSSTRGRGYLPCHHHHPQRNRKKARPASPSRLLFVVIPPQDDYQRLRPPQKARSERFKSNRSFCFQKC